MKKYLYVDTCIWLNLFKKEGNVTKGVPYWKIAEDFFQCVFSSFSSEILTSGIVTREAEIQLLESQYNSFLDFLEQHTVKIVTVLDEDKKNARKLESSYNFTAGFYDLLHLCIAKRLGAVLVTRDKGLLLLCKENNVVACRPEELEVS